MKIIWLTLASSILCIDPIIIKGTKFFNSKTGEEFIIKGVAYQPGGSGKQDPIANTQQLANAIPLFKDLGINTIRVYEAYPNLDHDKGMKMLADAGIYLILDLSNPKASINRDTPKYDTTLLKAFINKADAFAKYDNTLAYFAGNEVNNDVTNTDSNPFVKATIRDMKAHMKAQSRYIPIGYANNDDAKTLKNIVDYFNCGPEEERIDFFGYNIYSWCGDSDMKKSGYDVKTKMFANYGIPVFFSEYGCNQPSPRKFGDVPALYSEPMSNVFAGGLIYEFTNEENNYGITKVEGNDFSKLKDFDTYKKQLAKVTSKPANLKSYSPPNSNGSNCPTTGSSWKVADTLPPTPSEDTCSCLMKSYSCTVSKSFNVTDDKSNAGDIFKYACGEGGVDCTRLNANGEKGVYGDISFCDPATQLSYALSSMYTKSKNKDTCTNKGVGQVSSPSEKDESKCLAKPANIAKKASDNPQATSNGSGSGSSTSNPNFYLPSFTSLATATLIAMLLI
jgi:hypothetical protein